MDLEVFGAAHRLRLGLAHRGAHTRTRRVGETGGRAANSALQSHHDFLLIHRRVNAIHVIENLSGLEAGIILLPGLKTGFAAKTKMLIEHDGAPEAHEETTQGRRQGASAAGCAGADSLRVAAEKFRRRGGFATIAAKRRKTILIRSLKSVVGVA